jgi:methyl-accepting chemotaxis protein
MPPGTEQKKAPSKHPIWRVLLWPFRILLFFLLWPVIKRWRRKTRRSLRWRLAASHFAVVLYSIFAIAIVGIGLMILLAYVQSPTDHEAAGEASLVAKEFQELSTQIGLTDTERSTLLRAMATGELAPNINESNISVYANVGRVLGNVETISIVDRSERITASSNNALIGKRLSDLGVFERIVGARALTGNTNLRGNTMVDDQSEHSTGAYPLYNADDELVGAVVLSKTKRTFAPGAPFWAMVLQFFAVIGFLILALVGIPAVPIGIITGIRRARAISRPVSILAATADRFAQGDLSARVQVRGQDEVASLQHSFNSMADRLQGAMAR